jgi:hypothetical protein
MVGDAARQQWQATLRYFAMMTGNTAMAGGIATL